MSKFTNFFSFSLSFLHKDLLVCFLNLNLEMMKRLFRFIFFRIFLINFLCRVPLAFHAERLIPPVLLFFLHLFCVCCVLGIPGPTSSFDLRSIWCSVSVLLCAGHEIELISRQLVDSKLKGKKKKKLVPHLAHVI
jgi:hypothetical protein